MNAIEPIGVVVVEVAVVVVDVVDAWSGSPCAKLPVSQMPDVTVTTPRSNIAERDKAHASLVQRQFHHRIPKETG